MQSAVCRTGPLTTTIQPEKGGGAGSVGSVWFLSVLASPKNRGGEMEWKRLFMFSSYLVRVQLISCEGLTAIGMLAFSKGLVGKCIGW